MNLSITGSVKDRVKCKTRLFLFLVGTILQFFNYHSFCCTSIVMAQAYKTQNIVFLLPVCGDWSCCSQELCPV